MAIAAVPERNDPAHALRVTGTEGGLQPTTNYSQWAKAHPT